MVNSDIIKQLKKIFFLVTVISLVAFVYIYYKNYSFRHSPLPQKIIDKIESKKSETMGLVKRYYGIDFDVPVLISDQIGNRLYGFASYDQNNKKIKIVLNKLVMQESLDYMVDEVIPHEYAHALMFRLGYFDSEHGGHSKKWQDICLNLGGIKCEQYVDNHDIVIEKLKI